MDRALLRATPADRLDRYLGRETVEQISDSMRQWYGPPIPVKGVPGAVFATGGGDFIGPIEGGAFGSFFDAAWDHVARALRSWSHRQQYFAGAGLASINDLAARLSVAQKPHPFQKTGTAGVIGGTNSLWRVGNQPAAGAAAAGQPGGTVPDRDSTGALRYLDNVSPATRHFAKIEGTSTVLGNALLLYDRIFAVAKAMNSTSAETVTGAPTRYQSTSPADEDYVGGNFLFMECGSALPATAHNWTTCTYTDQGGASATLPSVTGISSCAANRVDMPVGLWFAPLASGDDGIRTLTQMQCSAAVASGTIDFVLGHYLGIVPFPVANMGFVNPGLDAMSLVRIFDGACLAFLELNKPATSLCSYTGVLTTVISA